MQRNLGKKTQVVKGYRESAEKVLFHVRDTCFFQKEEEQKDLGRGYKRGMSWLGDIFS